MIANSAARSAVVLIVLALIIAALLEAVFRICNILNAQVNGMFLAAGAICAAVIWSRGR
jgi:hypothetical protein